MSPETHIYEILTGFLPSQHSEHPPTRDPNPRNPNHTAGMRRAEA